MDTTTRVQRWRQRRRDEGKEAMTIWLSHDTKLRLEDLATVWRVTLRADRAGPGTVPAWQPTPFRQRYGNDTVTRPSRPCWHRYCRRGYRKRSSICSLLQLRTVTLQKRNRPSPRSDHPRTRV